MSIRPAAVSGLFYPANKQQLKADIQTYLDQATIPDSAPHAIPKIIVVPHAGYIHSGEVAASAYKLLLAARNKIKKIILLGPSHQIGFSGFALPSHNAFATPLGEVPVDINGCRLLLSHLRL